LTTQTGITYLSQESNLVNSRGALLVAGQTNVDNSVNQVIDQFLSSEEDFGYFGQVEANYKDQFIATVGYRLDKSSRNGDPNKFYGFPKASLAVNVANFDFWNVEAISQLKFRTAYGETGSPANFGATFTSLGASNIGGSVGQSVSGDKGDPNVEPETSAEFEIGFDLGLFENKVAFEATYYNKAVNDLILTRALPSSSGFARETTNLGDLVNKGIELALRADVVDNENFKWNTGLNWFRNRSEMTRLEVPAFPQPGAGFGLGLGTIFIQEGKPVNQFATNLDLDGDGVTEPTQIGVAEPDYQMGWNNNITLFKQFDVSFIFQMKVGGDNLNLSKFLTDLGGVTPDLETADGQARLSIPANGQRFLEPAGYLRLREAAVYYRLPSATIASIFGDTVEGVKLGVSGRNLFLVTDYSSYDPEVSVNGSGGLSTGIEVTPFPSSRQVYFHLNVNF